MTLKLHNNNAADRVIAGPAFYTDPAAEEGGFWDAAGAAYVNENSIASHVADLEYSAESESIDGYDQYADVPTDLSDMPLDTWRGVESPDDMSGRIAEVYAERQRLEMMATNGWGAFFGGMAGILTSPEIIPDLFVGRGQGAIRGAVKLGVSSFVAEAAHESIMHQQNYTRTMKETYVNMGLATFAGSAIGAAISRKSSTGTIDFLRQNLDEGAEPGGYVNPDGDLSAGKVREFISPEAGEEIANKPWLKWRVLGPIRQLVHSDAPTTWTVTNDLFEHSYTPKKTTEGVEKQFAVETEVNQEIGARMRSIKTTMNGEYKNWLKDTGANRVKDFRKNWLTFNKEVHKALVSGDNVPQSQAGAKSINATAKAMRGQFNELLATAKKYDPEGKWIGVDEMQVKFADSYAPRRYNRRKLQSKPSTFKRMLMKAFVADQEMEAFQAAAKEAGEGFDKTLDDFRITDAGELDKIRGQVDESYERMAYGYDQDVFMPVAKTGEGKPYAARVISIPDRELIAGDWLISDIESMTRSYMNRVLKPTGFIRRGYDPELKNAIDSVNAEYRASAEGKTDAEANRLADDNVHDRDALELLRDRFYGRTTISTSQTAEAVNDVLRTMRNFNVSRMMGMVLPISMGDVFRANMTTIYAPELGKAAPGLFDAIKTAKASKPLMQKFGVAHETAMMVRSGKMFDDSGLEGTNIAVEWSAAASRGLMKATGLMAWTDWSKLLAASYTQNDVAQKMLGFAKLSTRSKKQLADLGISEKWAVRFQDEIKANTGGITPLKKDATGYDATGYVFDYTKWKDQELAQQIQKVLFRESERNVVSPAVGEVPRLTASDEVNKMIFQFQNFLFGAAHSVTVNLGKRYRDRDPKGFQVLTQLMLGGMVSVGLREAAYGNTEIFPGQKEAWKPQDWVLNAMDYSSIAPIFMMGFNHVNLATGNKLVNDVLNATSMSRYSHRPLGSLLGPSVGTAEDALVAFQSLAGIPFGDELSPSDVRRLRRLIPWNNLMYVAAPMSSAVEQFEE